MVWLPRNFQGGLRGGLIFKLKESSEFRGMSSKAGRIKGPVKMKGTNFPKWKIQSTADALAIKTSGLSLKHIEFLSSLGIQGILGSQGSVLPTPHPGRDLDLASHFLRPELLPLLHTCWPLPAPW